MPVCIHAVHPQGRHQNSGCVEIPSFGCLLRLCILKQDPHSWQVSRESCLTLVEKGCFRLLHWRNSLPLVPHGLGATILCWFHVFSLVRGWVRLERLVPHFWAGFCLTSNVSHCAGVALLLLNVDSNRVLAKVAFSLVRVFRLLPRLGWCISQIGRAHV